MPKLVMTRGLPASGKSTYAKELIKNNNFKRVNKDLLREMIDDSKWTRGNEKFVLKARNNLISLMLSEGYNVVCDDTNFASKHEETLRQIAAQNKADFEIKEFEVSVEECIKRDLLRQKPVGKDVILRMFIENIKPEPQD